jgi:hypothetical protein
MLAATSGHDKGTMAVALGRKRLIKAYKIYGKHPDNTKC